MVQPASRLLLALFSVMPRMLLAQVTFVTVMSRAAPSETP
jgi:hypothetical protein